MLPVLPEVWRWLLLFFEVRQAECFPSYLSLILFYLFEFFTILQFTPSLLCFQSEIDQVFT